ncbi:hypothetical protein V6N13_049447 [Hibiscus sabdariffa]
MIACKPEISKPEGEEQDGDQEKQPISEQKVSEQQDEKQKLGKQQQKRGATGSIGVREEYSKSYALERVVACICQTWRCDWIFYCQKTE